MTDKKANSIKIKLVRSLIGTPEAQRKVVRGLGLTKKDQVVEHFESATIKIGRASCRERVFRAV